MRLVDRRVDDGDPDVLAAGGVGRQRDALESVVHGAGRLLKVVDMVRRAPRGAAVAGELRQHHADRAAVGDAVAHEGRVEQGRGPLRADFQPEVRSDRGGNRCVAVDSDQHLVGHEFA